MVIWLYGYMVIWLYGYRGGDKVEVAVEVVVEGAVEVGRGRGKG
jgi:hypothetical protein